MAIQERRTWLILAAMVATAFLLQILGCAIYDTWWPMLTAVLYIFIPMPYLFFGAATESAFSDSSSMWMDCGKFLTGFSAVGLVAIPVSLYHAEYINTGALTMELVAAGVLFVSALYYDYHSSRDTFF